MLPATEATPLLSQHLGGHQQPGNTRKPARAYSILAVLTVAALALASLVASLVAVGELRSWGDAHSGSWQEQQGEESDEGEQLQPMSLSASTVLGWREKARQAQQESHEQATPPNIIFILADDMGWNDVGWAGDDFKGLTPTLDALRQTGVELTSYYTQQLCTPARAALMTGRYPFKMGMQGSVLLSTMVWGLPTENVILPQFLSEAAGYRSHLVGKWHLGFAYTDMLPTSRGFTSSYGLMGGQADYLNQSCSDDVGYTDFLNSWTHNGAATDKQREAATELADGQGYACVEDQKGNYTTTLFTDRALQIADKWNDRGRDAPLFLYMAYQNPHFPVEYDPKLDYSAVQDVLDAITDDTRLEVAENVYSFDVSVAQLLAGLQERGALDNSIIVFASDNGGCYQYGQSNYPLRGTKNYTYEGGSRVRAFATSPLFPDGVVNTTYEGLFHITDWVPTLLEMAAPGWSQTEAAELVDGVNQLPVFMGNTSVQPRTELIYNLQQDLDPDGNPLLLYGAIREGDWKYIKNEDCQGWLDFGGRYDAPPYSDACSYTQMERCIVDVDPQNFLFNLKDDPYEMNDLSNQRPEVVSYFEERLQQLAVSAMTLELSEDNPESDRDSKLAWVAAGGCLVPWKVGDPTGVSPTPAPTSVPETDVEAGL